MSGLVGSCYHRSGGHRSSYSSPRHKSTGPSRGVVVLLLLVVAAVLQISSAEASVAASKTHPASNDPPKDNQGGDRKLFPLHPNKKAMSVNVFAMCSELHPEGVASNQTALLLQCISDTFQQQETDRKTDLHAFLFVVAGAMIFFMQAGFAMLCAGSVRIKNVTNTMLKNLLDACGSALAFFLVGYAFAFGGQSDEGYTDTTFLGSKEFCTVGPSAAFWFFQYTFSATSVTIVAGTLAERCQMAAVRCYTPHVWLLLWFVQMFLVTKEDNEHTETGGLL
jgi:Ammonium Transporter Family